MCVENNRYSFKTQPPAKNTSSYKTPLATVSIGYKYGQKYLLCVKDERTSATHS